MSLLTLSLWATILNVFICALGIGFYEVVHTVVDKKKFKGDFEPYTKGDVLQVVCSLLCNALIFVLGVWMYQKQLIHVSANFEFWPIITTVLLFILVMDVLMYVFHRLAHVGWIYGLVHSRHHEHTRVNSLSVFVLHPIEALGFGLLIIAVLLVFDLNVYGVSLYLLINLLWGTIGHFNFTLFSRLNTHWLAKYMGTASFHYVHHQNAKVNFGFYTTIWDRLLRTIA